jgi:hypothetical protein
LLDSAIPKVSIIKDGNYTGDGFDDGIESQVDVLALLDYKLRNAPLAGFVLEGLSPYGTPTSRARHQALLRAVYSGLPVARVGRGNNEGFAQADRSVHRRRQPDLDQGAPVADGVFDAVRQFAARRRSGPADRSRARGGQRQAR